MEAYENIQCAKRVGPPLNNLEFDTSRVHGNNRSTHKSKWKRREKHYGKSESCTICMHLAELAHSVQLVVGADELEVLHRRHGHAPVEIKPVVSLRVRRLPRLKKEHASVSNLLYARQLQG